MCLFSCKYSKHLLVLFNLYPLISLFIHHSPSLNVYINIITIIMCRCFVSVYKKLTNRAHIIFRVLATFNLYSFLQKLFSHQLLLVPPFRSFYPSMKTGQGEGPVLIGIINLSCTPVRHPLCSHNVFSSLHKSIWKIGRVMVRC